MSGTATAENGKILLDSIKSSGKVDFALSAHMNSSIAIFGDLYAKNKDAISKLPPKEQLEAIKKLADQSAELSPAAEMSGGTGLVKAYIKDLIARSETLDEKGKEGEHLKAWAEDVAKATKDIDFSKIYKPGGKIDSSVSLTYLQSLKEETIEEIRKKIRQSAAKNISPTFGGSTLEDDLVATIKKDDEKKEGKVFAGVKTDTPQPMGGDMFQLIITFIGMLLGVDLSGLAGGGKNTPEAQKKLNDSHIHVVSPEQQKKINELTPAAQHLAAGKSDAKDVEAIAKFIGVDKEKIDGLPLDRKKELGEQIKKSVIEIRNGSKTEEQAKKDIKYVVERRPTEQELKQYAATMKKLGDVGQDVLDHIPGGHQLGQLTGFALSFLKAPKEKQL